MKTRGVILVLLGIAGMIFVCSFDSIMKKPVNDITGPRSIAALIVCASIVILGIRFLLKRQS